jgi:hypothetical protein
MNPIIGENGRGKSAPDNGNRESISEPQASMPAVHYSKPMPLDTQSAKTLNDLLRPAHSLARFILSKIAAQAVGLESTPHGTAIEDLVGRSLTQLEPISSREIERFRADPEFQYLNDAQLILEITTERKTRVYLTDSGAEITAHMLDRLKLVGVRIPSDYRLTHSKRSYFRARSEYPGTSQSRRQPQPRL